MQKDNVIYKFLLVEDNPGDVIIIEDLIREQFSSPAIFTARNFKQAIAALSSAGDFNIILLDLSLPDKQGKPLIDELLGNSDLHCPVIILSGYADIDFSVEAISLGISDYLLKDELTAVILYKSIFYAMERAKLQRRIQESEKKFSQIFNSSPQPMWVYDDEKQRIIQVNQAAVQLYGYTQEEFLELDISTLHPANERPAMQRAVAEGGNVQQYLEGQFTHLKKGGGRLDAELYSTFILINEKPCRAVIAIDITEKKKAEQKITEAIIKSQEDERYALGSELHDNICQILAGSMLSLSTLVYSIDKSKEAVLAQGLGHIKLAANEIRKLSHRLAPAFFDDMDLKESLTQLVESINPDGSYETSVTLDAVVQKLSIKQELQIHIYRIVQEQLNNILKYAKATVIKIRLQILADNLTLEILDNGIGFDDTKVSKGIGFANMTRRSKLFSGSFEVVSSPGNGAKVAVHIPVSNL